MKNNNNKIAIIGFGRFGTLLSEILQPFGSIMVIEKKKISEKNVRQAGIEELADADWVIPAVPISGLEKVLKEINPHLKPGALLMDVCSVKIHPCRWLETHIKKEVEILGSHPMFGPDSAKNGLKDLQIVLCPLRINKETLKRVTFVFKKLGLRIILTSPKEHDREAAKSLALVHFLGRGLTGINIKTQTISTLGFERLLAVNETVTNDSSRLFLDMHRYNPYASAVREKYLKFLQKIHKEL